MQRDVHVYMYMNTLFMRHCVKNIYVCVGIYMYIQGCVRVQV